MVKDVREAETAIGEVAYGPEDQEKMNLSARKSIFCSSDIKKGEIFTENNIRVVRPGYGLEPKYFEMILGKKALVDISFGTPISFGMFGLD